MKWHKIVKSTCFRCRLSRLQTVTKLQKELSLDEADITLINKNKYHYEATWLHEA